MNNGKYQTPFNIRTFQVKTIYKQLQCINVKHRQVTTAGFAGRRCIAVMVSCIFCVAKKSRMFEFPFFFQNIT